MGVETLYTLVIFLLTYLFIILFYNKKSLIVWISVFLILILGLVSFSEAIHAIDLNVILLYIGMLFISELFLFSKMPDYLASIFATRAKKVWGSMLIICLFTGILSIFLENVAVVLLMAPIALSVSRKCEINPVPLFIGMAISSNLQGSATLIGDPPSMLLASFAKMGFLDFFFIGGKPSIFFAVQIGFIFALVVLYFFFKKNNKPLPAMARERHITIIPSLFVIALILLLIIASSIKLSLEYLNGTICIILGMGLVIWYFFHPSRKESMKEFLIKLDWDTALFLIGIFILVASLSANGILDYLSIFILSIGGGNPLAIFIIIVLTSLIFSAFIDNVPFLLAMLPVTQAITSNLGVSPYLYYFGLLVGASVGGNITPIGASANIVAIGIMKKQGYHVGFFQFMKIGLVFTLVAVLAACLFLWFVLA